VSEGRQFQSEHIINYLKILRSYSKAEVAESSPMKDDQTHDGAVLCCIRWKFTMRSWQVIYQDADGKVHQTASQLRVPESSFDGSMLNE